jgi:putative membrane protein
MTTWLKVIHIVAISFWCAGLLALPSLYVRRSSAQSQRRLLRLHHFTRFIFIVITSPAAFVAVGTGIGLIFLTQAYTAWMVTKLAAVGLLVVVHIWSSHTLIHLFEPGRGFARWRRAVMNMATIAAIVAVLGLVLGKPRLHLDPLLDRMHPERFNLLSRS